MWIKESEVPETGAHAAELTGEDGVVRILDMSSSVRVLLGG